MLALHLICSHYALLLIKGYILYKIAEEILKFHCLEFKEVIEQQTFVYLLQKLLLINILFDIYYVMFAYFQKCIDLITCINS